MRVTVPRQPGQNVSGAGRGTGDGLPEVLALDETGVTSYLALGGLAFERRLDLTTQKAVEQVVAGFEPPDPWVAAGPDDIVQSVNNRLRFTNRADC